ncbi:MAG: hypothetical protein WDN28_26625 [Chthoniobacter sp.]
MSFRTSTIARNSSPRSTTALVCSPIFPTSRRDALGYQLPHYWHLLVHGTRGLAETHHFAKEITVIKDGSTAPESVPTGQPRTRGYLEDYLQELRGQVPETGFSSAACLRASRLALTVQAGAKS